MNYYADVLLPIPLERNYTYAVPPGTESELRPGIRVAVPFGKSKLYTGLVARVHMERPRA